MIVEGRQAAVGKGRGTFCSEYGGGESDDVCEDGFGYSGDDEGRCDSGERLP
jgi:hypothetical protein